ncbi:MAG: hypothetical protein ACHP7N_11390 [Caulobacterales bacterium]
MTHPDKVHRFGSAMAGDLHPSTSRPYPFTPARELGQACEAVLRGEGLSCIAVWPDGEILRDCDVVWWRAALTVGDRFLTPLVIEIASQADIEFYWRDDIDVVAHAEPHILEQLDALATGEARRPIKSEYALASLSPPRPHHLEIDS